MAEIWPAVCALFCGGGSRHTGALGGLELALTHNTDIAVVIHGVTLAKLNNGNFCHIAAQRIRGSSFSQAFSHFSPAKPIEK